MNREVFSTEKYRNMKEKGPNNLPKYCIPIECMSNTQIRTFLLIYYIFMFGFLQKD